MADLVQRIMRRQPIDKSRTGVDQFCAFDYMGSAEFEFGATKKGLDLIRSKPVVTKKIQFGKYTAYFVGHEGTLEKARAFFTDQILETGLERLKEPSYLYSSYAKKDDSIFSICGWWELKEGWVLFKHPDMAQMWKHAVS